MNLTINQVHRYAGFQKSAINIVKGQRYATPAEFLHDLSRIGKPVAHPEHDIITRIKVGNEQASAAMRSKGMLPHSDGTFSQRPDVVALYVYRQGSSGGESTFTNTDAVLENAPQTFIEVLLEAQFRFSRSQQSDYNETLHETKPLLYERGDGSKGLEWRYDDLVQPELVFSKRPLLAAKALAWLKKRVEDAPKVYMRVEAGSVVILEQGYWLHGRTEITGQRELWRSWVNAPKESIWSE